MGTSTLGVVHSTKAMENYIDEMTGWLDGNGTEVQKAKEEV